MIQEGWESVENWLSRLGEGSRKQARWHLEAWLKWVAKGQGKFIGFSPDELVEYQRTSDNGSKFDILNCVQRYVIDTPGRHGYKKKKLDNVRSFFLHNRAELPRDRSFNIRGDQPRVIGTLTPEEIRHVVLSSNKAYRAIFLCMLQGALDQEMFTYWNENWYEDLVKQLKENPKVVKVDLPGRKAMKFEKPYYTFIGGDAIEAIQQYLKVRPDEARGIFVNQRGKPIGKADLKKYWTRHLRKLDIVKSTDKGLTKEERTRIRTGKNLHEIRDVFRSLWSKSPAKHFIGEYFMGHQIDALEYDKSFRDVSFYRREYLLALPMLQIMSSGRPFGQVEEDVLYTQQRRIEVLESELERLRAGRSNEIEDLQTRLESQEKLLRLLYDKLKVE